MSKISNIIEFLETGIKAEGLRQKAIANNVANLETPGYRRIDVKFELIYQPKQTPVKSNGNDVNLEAEVGQMVKNTLRHKAYIRLLSKKYKQMELAMQIK